MAPGRLRVGVVGVGVLGTHHARLYAASPDVELVGVYDVDGERAAQVAAQHGAQPFTDLDALAAATDALSVATPTDQHGPVVGRLLAAGRHVLVEKPLADSSERGRELVAAARAGGLVLMVGHVERFNPVITYLEGRLNQPLFIEAHRLASYPPPRPGARPRGTEVGVVLDLMIHDLEVILHLVRSPVETIDAVGLPILSPQEDIANARIRFANGCVANVTASRVSPERMRKIRVFQADAYLSLDYGERRGDIYTKTPTGILREPIPIEDANALQREIANFVASVRRVQAGEPPAPAVPGEHGLAALELAEQVARQAAANLRHIAAARLAAGAPLPLGPGAGLPGSGEAGGPA